MAIEDPQKHLALALITQGQYKQGPVGANLFIFHLPNEWSDFDLYYFFEQFKLGTIVSVRIMTDKTSGRSKGYGFVSYDNAPSAEKAISKINGKQALGKRLKVELKKGSILNSINYQKETADQAP
jgi:CUG-BP- and ETR3-like factor